jgi:hypothetical protein
MDLAQGRDFEVGGWIQMLQRSHHMWRSCNKFGTFEL